MGISEVRRLGCEIKEHENFILCYMGQTAGQYGVGFVINRVIKNNIDSFIGISERLAILNIDIGGQKISILQVYFPTTDAKETEIDELYESIEKALQTAYPHVILMGDFNAKVGAPKENEDLVMKQYGHGTRNNRGQKLINFALEHKLTIINTCFKKKPNQKWTWRSPNGLYKNEIDYILTNQPRSFTNLEILNLNYPSDHRTIRGTIKLSKHKLSRARFTNKQGCRLKCEEDIAKYKDILKLKLSEAPYHQGKETVHTCYEKISNAISESLKLTQGNKRNQKQKIIQERTEKLLQRRKALQSTKSKTRSMKNELSALYKIVNKYIKKDYSKYRQDTIMRHLQQCGSTKKPFKELRTNYSWIKGLKSQDKEIYKRCDIVNTATEFYRNLYSDNNNNITTSNNNKEDQFKDFIEIDETEVIETIKKLKLDKSPGSDNITNEVLKAETKQPIEQAGFRKGFSTTDHIHTIELIKEKYQEQQRTLYITFIDYQKAFDSVSHNSIWESLVEQGVEEVHIKTIQNIYNNNKGRIKLESTGPCFPIKRGVRQGDPLSPTLFITILENIINKLDWCRLGLRIKDEYLSHLRFADDLVLLSETADQMQSMIESLHQASTKIGLEMNLTKTKIMTNSNWKKTHNNQRRTTRIC
ncbi:Craniofacial development protein 2 [Eumeta japonica]|uniref:Craniofacial development protein 2 n=1 Tax=Eumeta variegata TaxID=151549 RepID=A0A4C1VFF8_EUMVA|nr:Craniofacial development protein 2 [Eumeta japonica]